MLLAAMAGVLAVAVSPAKARTWTDSTGKHTVEADLVKVEDGKVILKKPDGKLATVSVTRLSKADQEYLASLEKKSEGIPAAKQRAAVHALSDKVGEVKFTIHTNRPGRPLKWLTLRGAKVTDAALEVVKGFNSLELLQLTNTKVTDDGLEHLKALKELKTLEIEGGQVTPEGLKKLKQALPNCEISYKTASNKVTEKTGEPNKETKKGEKNPENKGPWFVGEWGYSYEETKAKYMTDVEARGIINRIAPSSPLIIVDIQKDGQFVMKSPAPFVRGLTREPGKRSRKTPSLLRSSSRT